MFIIISRWQCILLPRYKGFIIHLDISPCDIIIPRLVENKYFHHLTSLAPGGLSLNSRGFVISRVAAFASSSYPGLHFPFRIISLFADIYLVKGNACPLPPFIPHRKSAGLPRDFLFPGQSRKPILILTINHPHFNVDDGSSGNLCRFVVYWEVDYEEGYPEDPNFYFPPVQIFWQGFLLHFA